ncbi:MAG: hypothetical protein QM683_15700 [Lacrimispora sp.]
MRKNKLLAVIAVAMAVMMASTACGSKDNGNSGTKQESSAEANATETKAEAATVESGSEESGTTETGTDEADDQEEETTETVQNTASGAGNITSGVFTSISGKYQITPPQGWSVDAEGDESEVAFTSPDGNDMLEVTYVEGDDADGAREVYPDTQEEYKKLISRGEDMEFVRYDVKNGSDGSQTFRYAIRYKNPEDGVLYYAISGSYDAAAKKYISAAGTIMTQGSDAEKQIEASLDSLKLK